MRKFIDDYDEFIDISVDENFIKQFLSIDQDKKILYDQLLKIYKLDYQNYDLSLEITKEHIDPMLLKIEREILFFLYSRILFLVTICRMEQYIDSDTLSKKQIMMIKESIDCYKYQVEKDTMFILSACVFIEENFNTTCIFGKERDIDSYRKTLDEFNRKQKLKKLMR